MSDNTSTLKPSIEAVKKTGLEINLRPNQTTTKPQVNITTQNDNVPPPSKKAYA